MPNVCIPYVKNWNGYKGTVDLMELQDCDTKMKLEVLDFSVIETEENAAMTRLIKAANKWNLRKKFHNTEFNMSLTGTRLDSIDSGRMAMTSINDTKVLCSLLCQVKRWRLDCLYIEKANEGDWAALASAVKNGGIVSVKFTRGAIMQAKDKDLTTVWNSTDIEWRESWGSLTQGMRFPVGQVFSAAREDGILGLNRLLALRTKEVVL